MIAYSGLAGILAVVSLVMWAGSWPVSLHQRQRREAIKNMEEIDIALHLWFLPETGRYPTAEEFAQGVRNNYWSPEILIDPWGGAYLYRVLNDGTAYELVSLGADGAPGGTGPNADIRAAHSR